MPIPPARLSARALTSFAWFSGPVHSVRRHSLNSQSEHNCFRCRPLVDAIFIGIAKLSGYTNYTFVWNHRALCGYGVSRELQPPPVSVHAINQCSTRVRMISTFNGCLCMCMCVCSMGESHMNALRQSFMPKPLYGPFNRLQWQQSIFCV